MVLIDTGLETDAVRLRHEMETLGLDWRQTKAILLTHVHGDHTGGAEQLRAATGARIHAGQGDADVLRVGTDRDAFFSTFDMPDHSPHSTTVDVVLKGGEALAFGDATFEAIATPGHTPGSICYLLKRGRLRAIFGGDVIMQVDEHRAVGTYTAYLPPRFRGDVHTFLTSLRRLKELEPPELVLPGHPFNSPAPRSPRITAGQWSSMLDDAIAELDRVRSRYERDGASFLDNTPRALLPGLKYLGDRQGRAVYTIRAGTHLLVVDAPGGAGLLPFLKRQLGGEPSVPSVVLLTNCNADQAPAIAEMVAAGAQVALPRDFFPRAREICPPGTALLAAEDLAEKGFPGIEPIPLREPAQAPTAYLVREAGKAALLSGNVLIVPSSESVERLLAVLAGSRDKSIDYLASVQRLKGLNPDLWLPARPTDGRNANLYDQDWNDVIETHLHLGFVALSRHPGSALPRPPETERLMEGVMLTPGRDQPQATPRQASRRAFERVPSTRPGQAIAAVRDVANLILKDG